MNDKDFTERMKTWEVADGQAEQSTTWNIDDKGNFVLTIDPIIMANFIENLIKWDSYSDWMNREDCKNHKRSPVARENRRESIVLGNCHETVRCYLGRRFVSAISARIKELNEQKTKRDDK
jgi:hypothetical protein